MKLLFASDSFKDSLASAQTARLLTRAAREVFGDVECDSLVVSDGGEGAMDAILSATNGEKLTVDAYGPFMERRQASYGVFHDDCAIIETATVAGLALVPNEKRNPLNTTTYGVGALVRDALARGYRDIYLALGGSATNDGGMGCARALGARFLDAQGRELEGYGRDLERVAKIDVSHLDPRIADARVTVLSDVTNPLCGSTGATRVFGPQKGATPAIVERLERGMVNYRDVVRRQFGFEPDTVVGGGAAGGLGVAAVVFLRGKTRSGIDAILDLIDFDSRLQGVDLVVTGEGRTDGQSCCGKVMQGIGLRSRRAGVMAVGLSGSLGRDATKLFDYGIESLATTVDAPMSLESALARAEELYYLGAVRMFRLIRVGARLAKS